MDKQVTIHTYMGEKNLKSKHTLHVRIINTKSGLYTQFLTARNLKKKKLVLACHQLTFGINANLLILFEIVKATVPTC